MNLTEKQKEAVLNSGNILVEAGAGSGKTTLFVDRYYTLLKQDPKLKPTHILALTFTNKAASECLHRIYKIIHKESQKDPHFEALVPLLYQAPITTFHGFCKHLLQQYAFQLDISPLATILSDDESQFLAKKAIKECIQNALNKEHKAIETYLLEHSESRLENDLLACFKNRHTIHTYTENQKQTFTPLTQALLSLYKEAKNHYTRLKNDHICLDYNDLIEKTNTLLNIKHIQTSLQESYRYIMVDECQDTDPAQWDIITKLTDTINPYKQQKLFLVGDTKQCIYRFRGAQLSFFTNLTQTFNDNPNTCHVVSLTDNFRSSPDLLSKLNPIFEHIFEKTTPTITPFTPLTAQQAINGYLQCFFLKDSTDETQEFQTIHNYLTQSHQKGETVGILARERQYCEKIFNYLKQKGHSVQTDKQKGFFSQQLIIDCYLLIKVWIYPNDLASWVSLLQSPFFDLSMQTCQLILTNSADGIVNKISACLQENKNLDTSLRNQIKTTKSIIENWEQEKLTTSLSSLLSSVLYSETGYHYVNETPNGPYQIEIFLSLLINLEQNQNQTKEGLIELLTFKLSIHDSAFEMPQSTETPISIMTIHAAKGLEFDTVILLGCHKAFPLRKASPIIINKDCCHTTTHSEEDKTIRTSYFNQEEKEILDEEKRLFYVACTRAKKRLCLTGLYNANTKKPLYSYLSFLKSLPMFQETETSITFTHNNQPITIPCTFQSAPPQQNNKEDQETRQTTAPPTQYTFQKPKKRLQISDLVEKNKENLSLETIQHSLKGTLIHESIMYLLTTKNCTLTNLKNYCKSLHHFKLTTKPFQDTVIETLKTLATSVTLKQFQQYNFMFEHPLSDTTDGTIMTGRADAIAITNEKIILLEIKTDHCYNIKELINRYQIQLDYYQQCLQKTTDKPIQTYLYSSHLDEAFSQF